MVKKYKFIESSKIIYLSFCICLSINFCYAREIKLSIPTYGIHEYFHELILKSLSLLGHNVKIEKLSPDYSGTRLLKLLRDGKLSLHWRGQTASKDKEFLYVKFNVTKGLKGKRVLWIPKGKQETYTHVKSLIDFRNLELSAALGKGWSDVKIWKLNNLKYKVKDGKWDPHIYKMLANGNRGYDYFPKAITSVAKSLANKKFPFLDVEKHLVLVYDKDFRFYLHNKNLWLKNEIEKALRLADKKGLIDKLLHKHFPYVYDRDKLNLKNRTVIKLKM